MTRAPRTELTAASCREQSERCRALAKQVMTQAHSIMLEHIAQTWDRIASDIEERT